MILFQSDYIKHPNVHIHVETKNKSFIKMWKILKDMGIKNNKFHLTLLQKELKDIDLYELKDPSAELRMKIFFEIENNPWYYFREVIRIPRSGVSSVYLLNRLNLAMIWLFLNHIDYIGIAPRQLGKTLTALSICSYPLFFANMNTITAMLTKDTSTRLNNVKKIIDIRDELPKYLILDSNKDKTNAQEIYYETLNNKYETFVNQRDPLGAEALGRGLTSVIQHWDEIAFFRYNYISFPAALSAMNEAATAAKENNQYYGLIFTTTAGQLDVKEGEYVYNEFVTRSVMFNESFYDLKDKEELDTIIKTNSKNSMVLVEYNPLQLGKSIEWIRERTIKIKNTGIDTIKRDMFNVWTYGSRKGRTLPPEIIEKLKTNEKEPMYVQKLGNYLIYWYISKEIVKSKIFNTIPIVLGFDGSENVGEDFSTLVFLDARDASVLGRMSCNESNIITLGKFIAEILIKNPNIVFIPERNSIGVVIIDTIILEFEKHKIDPFKRIYNTFLEENITTISQYKSILKSDLQSRSKEKTLGFRTTGKSRDYLYSYTFKRAIKYNYNKLHDKNLINEFVNLRIKNGRIDHESGKHDDLVIAYLLALYLLLYSKCLHIYFHNSGISYEPLCDYIEENEDNNEEKINMEEFDDILNEIKETEEKLIKAKSKLQKMQLLHYLKFLKSLLPEEDMMKTDNVLTMNELVHKHKHNINEEITKNEFKIPSEYYIDTRENRNKVDVKMFSIV